MIAMSFSMATTMPLITEPSSASLLAEGLFEQGGEILATRVIVFNCRHMIS